MPLAAASRAPLAPRLTLLAALTACHRSPWCWRSRSCSPSRSIARGRSRAAPPPPRPPPAALGRRPRASTARRCPPALPRATSRSPTRPAGASRSARYRGQVTILAFLYSTCGATCVLIAQQIRGALDELPAPRAGADRQRRPRRRHARARQALPRAGLADRARPLPDRLARAAAPDLARLPASSPASAGTRRLRPLRLGPPARPRRPRAGPLRARTAHPRESSHDVRKLHERGRSRHHNAGEPSAPPRDEAC